MVNVTDMIEISMESGIFDNAIRLKDQNSTIGLPSINEEKFEEKLILDDTMKYSFVNPWQVGSIESFTYLKCPECVFDTKEKTCFQNHAIENHPLSHVLFGKKGNNSTILNFDPNGFNSEYNEKSEKLRFSTNLHETSILKEEDLKIKNIETTDSLGENILVETTTEERESKDSQQNSISDGVEKKLCEYSLKSHIELRHHDIENNIVFWHDAMEDEEDE